MTDSLVQPTTPDELAQADYGDHLIWRLVGSKITMFGANAAGEILLTTEKEGVTTELIVGKDETGDIALFEVTKEASDVA